MSDDQPTASELPADLASEAAAMMSESEPGDALAPGAAAPADAPADSGIDTAEMLASLLQITFNNVIAPRRGDHWLMDQGECETLGQAYGAVVDKYFPDISTGPEVTAVLVSVMVFGPRVAQDVAIAKSRAAATATAAPDPGEPADDGDGLEVAEATAKDEPFGFMEAA